MKEEFRINYYKKVLSENMALVVIIIAVPDTGKIKIAV